jgi:hypothetical protein
MEEVYASRPVSKPLNHDVNEDELYGSEEEEQIITPKRHL